MPRQHTNMRTSAYLRERGFNVAIAQHWNHYSAKRHDAYGFIDCLATRADFGIVAAQAMTKTRLADHRASIELMASAKDWLASGGLLLLFSWRKVGAKGTRLLWKPRIEKGVLADGRIVFIQIEDIPALGRE